MVETEIIFNLKIIAKKCFEFLKNLCITVKKMPLYIVMIYIASLVLFGVGRTHNNEVVMNAAMLIAFSGAFIIYIKNLRVYWLTFLFFMCIFLFLLGKPLIYTLQFRPVISNVDMNRDINSIAFGVFLIIISMISISIGAYYGAEKLKDTECMKMFDYKFDVVRLKKILIILMILSFPCVVLRQVDKIYFSMTHTYLEYYTEFVSQVPPVLRLISNIFFPVAIMYLATFPKKTPSTIVLLGLIFANLGDFVIGIRSKIMLPMLFAFIYYIIRQYFIKNDTQNWLSKKTYVAMIVLIPMMFVGLFSYNYIRNGLKTPEFGLFNNNPIVSFVDQQGMSYIVATSAYNYMDKIREPGFPGYTLGPIEDSLKFNSVSVKLFGTPTLDSREKSLQNLTNFDHQLSYAIYNELYMSGSGVGAIYFLEVFYDYGYIGVVIFNFLLGWWMTDITDFIKKNYVMAVIGIVILYKHIWMIRANTVCAVIELFNIYNLFTFAGVYILYKTITIVKNKKKGEADRASTAE